MSENCCYSFSDLFKAARFREATTDELRLFQSMSQSEKNEIVRELVGETKGGWHCEDRLWEDGITYTAFWKKRS